MVKRDKSKLDDIFARKGLPNQDLVYEYNKKSCIK